ncbi:MAG TPA: hypothetical protein VD978_29430 [Azospirillum sp.]|nr:hypothetical protein [Azospirillum sp.]
MSKHFLAGASAFALLATMSASNPAAADPPSLRITVNERAASPGPVVGGNSSEDWGSRRDNRLEATGNAAQGLLEASQNNGSNNALTTVTGVQAGGRDGSVKTRNSVGSSTVFHIGVDGTLDRSNTLQGSLTGFQGIATVRQNNGDGNDMGAVTGVLADPSNAAGAAGQAAVTDGVVQLDSASGLIDVGSVRQNAMDGSLNNARGIATIQQNNGNANAVSAATTVGINRNASAVSQQAASLGIVDSIATLDPTLGLGMARGNQVNGSLNGARGLFTIQQNNGDGNVQGVSNAVNVGVGRARLDQADQSATAASSLRFGFTRQGAGELTGDRSNAAQGVAGGDARGVINAQQDNGDSNAVTTANAISATPQQVGRLRSNIQANAQADSGETDSLGAGVPARTDRGNAIGGQTAAGFRGMATVQQNNGDTNAMAAASGVQATGGGDSSFRVGGAATTNWLGVADTNGVRRNAVDGSFNGADGLASLQQNNGDGNALSVGNGVGVQTRGGDLRQTTEAGATRAGGTFSNGEPGIRTTGGERSNTLTDSFRDGNGLVTLQQNNGSGNAMNAANSLFASLGNADNGIAEQRTRADAASAFGETLDSAGPGEGRRSNAISGRAFNGARGAATVQQNNGDNNALGAATSVTVDRGGRTGREATVSAKSDVASNAATARRTGGEVDRSNRINNGFTDFRGAATVQQNNGDGNALSSASGVTASRRGDESARRQAVSANTSVVNPLSPLTQDGVSSTNDLVQGFNGAAGVGTVQQNTGNGNAVAAATAFDAGAGHDARQSVDAVGSVASVIGTSEGATRENRIERSFTGAKGVFTVQQNTGDGNAIGAATGVMVGTPSASRNGTAQAALTVDSRTNAVDTTDRLTGGAAAGLRGTRSNTADRAFNDAAGVATLQQNGGAGNSINAGTLVQADERGGKQTARAAVDSKTAVSDNRTRQRGRDVAGVAGRSNGVDQSLDKAKGVFTVQQNTGDGNAIGAGTAVAATRAAAQSADLNRAAATADASVRGNRANQVARTEHRNAVTGSANGAAGILSIQQNTGDNNAMSSSTAVTAADGRSGFGNAVNLATLSATVADNRSIAREPGSQATNQVSGSFQGLRGLSSLQQNNGHNNAMQSAIVVTATY